MSNTLTIVIKDGDKEYMVNMEDNLVRGGSIRVGNRVKTLAVSDAYKLCGYPYVEMKQLPEQGEPANV